MTIIGGLSIEGVFKTSAQYVHDKPHIKKNSSFWS